MPPKKKKPQRKNDPPKGDLFGALVGAAPQGPPSASKNFLKFVKGVEIPEELPILPDPLREFAYRYAVDLPKHYEMWGRIFNVRAETIKHWLYREDVVAYIKKIRYDRRLAMEERLQRLEISAIDKLQSLLEQPFLPETMREIREGIQDVLTLLGRSTEQSKQPVIPSISTSISVQQGQVAQQQAGSDKSIEQLKKELKDLEEEDDLLFGKDGSDVNA